MQPDVALCRRHHPEPVAAFSLGIALALALALASVLVQAKALQRPLERQSYRRAAANQTGYGPALAQMAHPPTTSAQFTYV